VHCELPTQFGVHKVGDVRLGKRLIIDRARAKLRTLGHEQAAAAQEDVGALKLNVTDLATALGEVGSKQEPWGKLEQRRKQAAMARTGKVNGDRLRAKKKLEGYQKLLLSSKSKGGGSLKPGFEKEPGWVARMGTTN
jgi:hypothetical protein|tara:strand:+ start:176 stop:586 length:411 start_codon:yes stop_codon:yes gene_type:complete